MPSTTELGGFVLAIAIVLIATTACGPEPRASLLSRHHRATPPDGIADACVLAHSKCSRCHDLERIDHVNVAQPFEWERYVDRMQRKPNSNFNRSEARVISECLVYRQFGRSGLDQLSSSRRAR